MSRSLAKALLVLPALKLKRFARRLMRQLHNQAKISSPNQS